MYKIIYLALSLILATTACKKETLLMNDTPVVLTPGEKTLSAGTFVSGQHTTTGSAKIIEDETKNQFLVLENLKTDSGPDLRIYLSEDKTISNAVEVTSDIVIGNSKFALPTSADLNKQKNVLIWCKKFSVLFGSVELK